MNQISPSSLPYARTAALASIRSGFIPEPSQRTPEWLVACLEDAGRTLQALPARGTRPSEYGNGWPDVVHDAEVAYGWAADRIRPAFPGAKAIARMDEIYSWIGLIPESQRLLRRIVLLRSLVDPVSNRHRFSWRKVAVTLGCHHASVQTWHENAIVTILTKIEGLQPIDITQNNPPIQTIQK
jgi:hypothetical protein